MAKRIVDHTEKSDGVLVAVCWHDGDSLKRRLIADAARDILDGEHTYVAKAGKDGVEAPLRVTVRTAADDTVENNLLELPDCHRKRS